MKVIMLAEAIADMEASREFYLEHASIAVAGQFLDQVERASKRLAERPFLGAPVTPALRRLLLKQFPYSLIYQVDNELVTILAVAAHRRRPGYWAKRR